MNRIDRFWGDYRFLSNFWPASVYLEGDWYPSVEHAYQAAKFTDKAVRLEIKNAKKPGEAKKLGNLGYPLRSDWDLVRIQYMRNLVWQKFSLHQNLQDRLLATGEAELIEGNTWHDTFWGVCNGVGQNWLGKILMEVRVELKKQQGERYGI